MIKAIKLKIVINFRIPSSFYGTFHIMAIVSWIFQFHHKFHQAISLPLVDRYSVIRNIAQLLYRSFTQPPNHFCSSFPDFPMQQTHSYLLQIYTDKPQFTAELTAEVQRSFQYLLRNPRFQNFLHTRSSDHAQGICISSTRLTPPSRSMQSSQFYYSA